MSRTRVKVCGITRPEDGAAAAEMGVDAIGLVFYPPSSRYITTERARSIVADLPPFVTVVGLFLNASAEDVSRTLDAVPLAQLQFHGGESPAFCRAFGCPYIKSIAMGEALDVVDYAAGYSDASGYLVDSHRGGGAGGTGETFDWARVPRHLARALILAGGLTPDNVAAAIAQVGPYAVDVSTGVERSKGIKDREKLLSFMRGVERGDSA